MKRVAVFGVGYVGCVTAACLARDGHQVIGVDIDEAKVEQINQGVSPVAEPGLDEMVKAESQSGRLRATTDAAQAVKETDVALIAVGTPSAKDGSVSLGALHSVINTIGQSLRDCEQPYVIVVRSTLMPGILESQLVPKIIEASGRELGPSLRVCNNPEFLRESTAIRDYDDPPYVVVGVTDDWDADDVLQLYSTVEAEQIVTDSRTAALVKYTCNAFHALKVAFGNEIGSIAKSLDANGLEVMDLVCRDTKLNISPAYLRPGFAFGGSCLPKDVRAITRKAELDAIRLPILNSIMQSNQEHLQRAIDQIEETKLRRVGMVGLSFKAGTDDLRESPFVTLAEYLLGKGIELTIFDPGISLSRLHGQNLAYVDQHLPHLANVLVEEAEQLISQSDLLVVGTRVGDDAPALQTTSLPKIDLRNSLVVPSEQLANT